MADVVPTDHKNVLVSAVPKVEFIFHAFERISFFDLRYVVIGQDPYFSTFEKVGQASVEHAIGVAFGVPECCPPGSYPPSLRKILTGVYGNSKYPDPSLFSWAGEKKILLLNAALTVPRPRDNDSGRKVAGSDLLVWEEFTTAVVRKLALRNKPPTFVCWGRYAERLVDGVSQKLGRTLKKTFCFHPMASKSSASPDSFARFWTASVGKQLRMKE